MGAKYHFVEELLVLYCSQLFHCHFSRVLVRLFLGAGAIGNGGDVTRHLGRGCRRKNRLGRRDGFRLHLWAEIWKRALSLGASQTCTRAHCSTLRQHNERRGPSGNAFLLPTQHISFLPSPLRVTVSTCVCCRPWSVTDVQCPNHHRTDGKRVFMFHCCSLTGQTRALADLSGKGKHSLHLLISGM